MSENQLNFGGSVPDNYEGYLGPFVFEPFAVELAGRVRAVSAALGGGGEMSGARGEGSAGAAEVLELACGTGRLTRHLPGVLPPAAKLIASDLNADMLVAAKRLVPDERISWATVDMLNISYEEDRFDLIISQFGLMLVPDRRKALAEIYRVLKPGGRVLFSVWGAIAENDIWAIGGRVVESFIGVNPIFSDPGPFTMQDQEAGLRLMREVGFVDPAVHSVSIVGVADEAARAAKGFIHGLPINIVIRQKDPGLMGQVEEALTAELVKRLGDRPMRSPLNALVFEARK